MPELPEVEHIARQLRQRVVGRTVTACTCRQPAVVRPDWSRLESALRGQTLEEVGRHGKYLFLRFGASSLTAVHLGMTGQLLLLAADRPPDRHTHLELTLSPGEEKLAYRDVRRFGGFELLAGSAAEFLAARRLGPDALTAGVCGLARGLAGRRLSVKGALLNQSVVAGVGNIYADESLYRAGLSPLRPAGSLSAEEIEALWEALQEVLQEAIARGGTTLSDYVDTDNRRGGFQDRLRVYGRAGEPCPRCGQVIRKVRLAGRGTHFCPGCQKEPDGGEAGR